jgi:hypothetical protein
MNDLLKNKTTSNKSLHLTAQKRAAGELYVMTQSIEVI